MVLQHMCSISKKNQPQSDIFQFSDSFFDTDNPNLNQDLSSSDASVDEENQQQPELKEPRKRHSNTFITAHLNMNSIIRHRFSELTEVLENKLADLLLISEMTTDSSFHNELSHATGNKLERQNRNSRGGIAAFNRQEVPARRRKDLESKTLENITIKVILNKTVGYSLHIQTTKSK